MSRARVTNLLPQFIAGKQQKAATAMTSVLVLGASEASVLTPIDTSTLINSQVRDVSVVNGKITGRAGYTAAYAKHVHNPDVKQTFRRATAEKEFLRKGFERSGPRIRSILIEAMK